MTAATKLPPTDTGRCGEFAGFRRHHRRDEYPCKPCETVGKAKQREWRQANREAVNARERAAAQARRSQAVLTPLPSTFGRFVCQYVPHAFTALFPTMGEPFCRDCFGFSDDPRHL